MQEGQAHTQKKYRLEPQEKIARNYFFNVNKNIGCNILVVR
jgi:hypothetical protein